jgi:hypothetical protein
MHKKLGFEPFYEEKRNKAKKKLGFQPQYTKVVEIKPHCSLGTK